MSANKSDDEGEGEGDNVVGYMYGAGSFCKINWAKTSSGRGKLIPHHEWDEWMFIRKILRGILKSKLRSRYAERRTSS